MDPIVIVWTLFATFILIGAAVSGVLWIRRSLRMDGPTQQDRRQEEKFKMLLEREVTIMKGKKPQQR
ncbi:MAG: hypothetical protein HC921_16045 [Synechococcaceae cyanobacterium SM2_3_1]|nr:hypothetical protein [Synechococcaceae cyanobacterium SM2_3_1]